MSVIAPTAAEIRAAFVGWVRGGFSGYVDLEQFGLKRRFFFVGGKLWAAQSAAQGENLCDFLTGERKLTMDLREKCLARVREKKEAMDVALAALAVMPEPELASAIGRHAAHVLSISLGSGAQYTATPHAGLEGKLRGFATDVTAIVDVPQQVLDIQTAHDVAKNQDFYQRLGVAETASQEEIRKAYFEMAKRWHSDKFSGVELGNARSTLERLFGFMSEAHATLGDAAKRKDFDLLRQRKAQGLPTDVGTILDAEDAFKRGQMLLTRGSPEAALTELEKAMAGNSGEAEFHAAYGLALYLAKNDSERAIAALKKSLEMSDKSATAHEYLGRVYRGLNKVPEARKHFNKCLELDPKNISAQRELRLMNMRESSKPASAPAKGGLFGLFKK